MTNIPRDPFQKARLLEAAGEFKTQKATEVLSGSLADTRVSGLPLGLTDGWSLRVCDIAYNTLVHRLRLSQFRSPLGTSFAIPSRDRWIKRLHEWLKGIQDQTAN